MALIERHPEVDDYILELSLQEIRGRGGVADLVEEGRLVIIKDFRLDLGQGVLDQLAKSTDGVKDPDVRRQLKKLESTAFFEAEAPKRWRRSRFKAPVTQALFETLCKGDADLFQRASTVLRQAHESALRVYEACFAGYQSYRLIPSVRLTRTMFENLHWDEHWIEDDFHTARVFANLDSRPRIWHLSHRFPEIVRRLYRQHGLERFAGRDPNELLSYINSKVLGGLSDKSRDHLPRHRIAFEPGQVWVGESRLIAHQIYYGEAALVYMWLVKASSMANPDNRFNAQVERVHAEMRQQNAVDAGTASA